MKRDGVRAGREIDTAHQVVATQQGLGFAVHLDVPVRIVAIVEQEDCGPRRRALKHDVLRSVAGEFDSAGFLVGDGCE